MHPTPHGPALSRIAVRVPLAMLLCAMALGLTQCKLAVDTLTGVRVTPERAVDCLKECERLHHEAIEAEVETHRKNVQACGDGDDDNDKACRDREHDRHEAAVKAITADFKRCRNDCHHQGGGHGG